MNKHSVRLSVLLTTVLGLSGCGSAPLSFLEGVPRTRTDPALYPVRVVSIDGDIYFNTPSKPIQVTPGPHWIVFEAAPGRGARGSVQKSFTFMVEPCRRYHLAARRSSPMDADWSLTVDTMEPVAGCSPDEELKKAGVTIGVSGSAPAASAPR
jgi:hypothetical protein